jgi:hypothetical protein
LAAPSQGGERVRRASILAPASLALCTLVAMMLLLSTHARAQLEEA